MGTRTYSRRSSTGERVPTRLGRERDATRQAASVGLERAFGRGMNVADTLKMLSTPENLTPEMRAAITDGGKMPLDMALSDLKGELKTIQRTEDLIARRFEENAQRERQLRDRGISDITRETTFARLESLADQILSIRTEMRDMQQSLSMLDSLPLGSYIRQLEAQIYNIFSGNPDVAIDGTNPFGRGYGGGRNDARDDATRERAMRYLMQHAEENAQRRTRIAEFRRQADEALGRQRTEGGRNLRRMLDDRQDRLLRESAQSSSRNELLNLFMF
jgi:hypothetical protein